jgi:NAD(P)-dependent dehydrogenase (short-subunit alcohol dehydrogenase family)
VKAVIQRWGRIDVLCNNAGIMDQTEPAHRASLETWERVFRVNATGVFLMTKAVLPHMLARKAGVIVNTASEAGIRGGAAGTVYTASKHACVGITRNIATMYRKDGIRCNAVCPGGVMTNIMMSAGGPLDAEGDKALIESRAGMGRIVEPAEIALAMVFLASDAASNVNGVIMPVDNGWSAG